MTKTNPKSFRELHLDRDSSGVCPFHHASREEEISTYDPLATGPRIDPWRYYEWLALNHDGPVYKIPSEQHYYMVSGYDEVKAVLYDPETYSSQLYEGRDIPLVLFLSGKSHKRVRGALQPFFTREAVAGYQEKVQKITDDFTEKWIEKGTCDLVSNWSSMISLKVVAQILGLDTSKGNLLRLLKYANAIDRAVFPLGGPGERPTPDMMGQVARPMARELTWASPKIIQLTALIGIKETMALVESIPITVGRNRSPRPNYTGLADGVDAIASLTLTICKQLKQTTAGKPGWQGSVARLRRAVARDHVIYRLAQGMKTDEISLPEIIMACLLVLVGGGSTTASLLETMVITLAQNPRFIPYLRAHPEAQSPFIEELLRIYPSLARTLRRTTQDVELGGTHLPAGSQLILLNGAANVDPKKFPEPWSFLPGRSGQKHHLAFGRGVHYCLGAHLARLEAACALRSLLEKADHIGIDDRHPPEFIVNRDTGIYGFESLWVKTEQR